jgi:hypothetical protein
MRIHIPNPGKRSRTAKRNSRKTAANYNFTRSTLPGRAVLPIPGMDRYRGKEEKCPQK